MSTATGDQAQPPPAFHSERPRRELARILRRRRRLRAGIVQLLGAALAIALAIVLPGVAVGFNIPSNRAVEMLLAVGAGTVAFIGIVFSLLFLVVQYSSTNFTPRLNLFRDAPIVWRAFALYTAVVVYSFTASLVIGRSDYTSGLVPIVAFAGVLISLVVYRRLQMAAFASIQLAFTLRQIAERGRGVIDGLYTQPWRPDRPAEPSERAPDAAAEVHEIRWPRHAATLQVIDVPRVLRAAERSGTTIAFQVRSGGTLSEDAVVATATGQVDSALDRAVLKALTVGDERTFEQDPELPVRLLADIALRALSPAVNDPTTAVQAIDAIDALLRVLATRDLDVGKVAGSDGSVRVAVPLPTWGDYLEVAFDDVTALPVLAPSVGGRITRLLDDLAALTTGENALELAPYRRRLIGR